MANLAKGMMVELRPGRDEVYPRAYAASRGTVRGTKVDDWGYSKVYIEWDKEHWRYNGEVDGWTYADHFRPIEDSDEDELEGPEIFDVRSVSPSDEENERIENYLNMLMAACDRAAESEGFYFITLKRDGNNQIHLDVIGAATDDELMNLPSADLFHFVEQEMRRKED